MGGTLLLLVIFCHERWLKFGFRPAGFGERAAARNNMVDGMIPFSQLTSGVAGPKLSAAPFKEAPRLEVNLFPECDVWLWVDSHALPGIFG